MIIVKSKCVKMTDESGHELQIGYAVYLGEFIRCRGKK